MVSEEATVEISAAITEAVEILIEVEEVEIEVVAAEEEDEEESFKKLTPTTPESIRLCRYSWKDFH